MRLKEIPQAGRVVRSLAGHDKGRYYIVLAQADERCLWVCDGQARRVDNPKKKKYMHLDGCPFVAEEIAEKLKNQKKVYDADVQAALKRLASKNPQC